ncbi:MAG: threonine--tRNA ligase [Nanobdellota archaeon]
MKIEIEGKKTEYDHEVDGLRLIEDLAPEKGEIIAMKVNGKTTDLTEKITDDAKIEFISNSDDVGKEILKHSAAHLLAAAVEKLYPEVKFAIGPAIEEGFYYDMECEETFSPEALKSIEKEMYRISKKKTSFKRFELSKKQALEKVKGNPYKTEIINELEGDIVSFYSLGEFEDVCRGPHVPHAGHIRGFKLTKVAGAYWRGDQKNKQLQRIYGVAFPTKEELKEHLKLLEEAKKRDHRKLGKELKLFSIHDEAPGKPFWKPRGCFIFNKLIDFWRQEHEKAGYVEIKTPIILNRSLWETSGHWQNYKENMYTTNIDGEDFAIKPMNCPGGFLVYKEEVHSYKELPLRMGEIGLVHRHELSGVLSGLMRVRQFHQDDAHIFMTQDQITEEILGVLNLADKFYKIFGLDYHLELSTRPDKSIGTDEQWENATEGLKSALDKMGKGYIINEGDGAFYGPKIDIHLKDALGRTWQCGTIQLDMSMPERFDLTYVGEDGQNTHRPVLIHRVIYGSLERFIGILIEHFAGKFPLWLNPVQVKILTVSEKFNEYAQKVKENLQENNLRVEMDDRAESIPKKVRDAQREKINYILVIGENEEKNNTVNVRTRNNEVQGEVELQKFIDDLFEEVKTLRI